MTQFNSVIDVRLSGVEVCVRWPLRHCRSSESKEKGDEA